MNEWAQLTGGMVQKQNKRWRVNQATKGLSMLRLGAVVNIRKSMRYTNKIKQQQQQQQQQQEKKIIKQKQPKQTEIKINQSINDGINQFLNRRVQMRNWNPIESALP